MKKRRALLLVLALSAAGLLWQLGARGLNEPDEGRYGSIAADIHRTGDWLVPRLHGAAHFNKPPMTYWLMAVLFHLGGVNEWMARLPAALAALGVVALTFALGCRLFDPETAACASLVLLTCPLFFILGRVIDPNMLLAFWVTLAMWAAVAWRQDGRPGARWIFYVALGFSFFTKGPVGIAFVGLALLGHRWLRGSDLPRRSLWHGPGAALGALIGLWWFVAVAARYPELWRFFVGQEVAARVLTQAHNRGEPFYYYLYLIPLGLLPWLPSLWPGRPPAPGGARRRLPAAWILFPVILLTCSGSKMPAYVLPVFPALALLLGHRLRTGLERRAYRRTQLLFLLLVAAAVPLFLEIRMADLRGWESTFAIRDLVWAAGAVTAAAALARAGARAVPFAVAGASLMLCVYLGALGPVTRNETRMGPQTTARGIGQALAREARSGDEILLVDRMPNGLDFYLARGARIPVDRIEFQTAEDREALRERAYGDEAEAYRRFDSTQRVHLVLSPRLFGQFGGRVGQPPVVVYRDGRYVAVRNR
jgi:4-amino-4-deoxy-L-arabinose transferase-like glycosyltransferase